MYACPEASKKEESHERPNEHNRETRIRTTPFHSCLELRKVNLRETFTCERLLSVLRFGRMSTSLKSRRTSVSMRGILELKDEAKRWNGRPERRRRQQLARAAANCRLSSTSVPARACVRACEHSVHAPASHWCNLAKFCRVDNLTRDLSQVWQLSTSPFDNLLGVTLLCSVSDFTLD